MTQREAPPESGLMQPNGPQSSKSKSSRPRKVSKRPLYEPGEFDKVVRAYKDVFRELGAEEMASYWDLGATRKRAWSCLTTDFRTVDFEQLLDLHHLAQDICERDWADRAVGKNRLREPTLEEIDAKGRALKACALDIGAGYSIGVCPWTDNGLFKTWAPKTRGATILLGHDWYPIVPVKEHPIESPLRREGLHWTSGYRIAAPSSLLSGDRVMIFLNLMPDYRPPGTATTGDFDQDHALPGFLNVLEAVVRRFKGDVQVISWGLATWEALRCQITSEEKRLPLTECTTALQGRLLQLPVGKYQIPYLPIVHPALPHLNFKKDAHMRHVDYGFAQLALASRR